MNTEPPSLLRFFASLPPEEAAARVEMLTERQAEEVRNGWAKIRAREEQVALPGEWRTWLLLAGRRFGKALALDTAIPTTDGWSTMGRLRAGDEVYDECGRPYRVTAAHPGQLGRPCFRITFDDGASLGSDHRWLTWDKRARRLMADNKSDRSSGGANHLGDRGDAPGAESPRGES